MKTYIRLIVYVLSGIGTFVTTAGSVFSILVLPPSFPLRGGEQRTGAQPKDVWADQGRVVWSFAGLAVRGCPDAADRFRKMKHRRVQKRISKAFPLTFMFFSFVSHMPHACFAECLGWIISVEFLRMCCQSSPRWWLFPWRLIEPVVTCLPNDCSLVVG